MTRTTIKALYLGKPVVWQVDEVAYFAAGDKYVTAHHLDGSQLLLTDTIKQLTRELAERFVIVDRGILVARNMITGTQRHPERIEGVVFLRGLTDPIRCSRRNMRRIEALLRAA